MIFSFLTFFVAFQTNFVYAKTNPEDRRNAVDVLKKKDDYYERQRLEVTGITSTDDTFREFPGMFDSQVKPSFFYNGKPDDNSPFKAVNKIYQSIFSLAAAQEAISIQTAGRGVLSPRGKEALKNYQLVQINEIVAHSLGTEIIYDAIYSGYIKPPKKLILIGGPDFIISKWRNLAQLTGTEIHVVMTNSDLVALWGGPFREHASLNSKIEPRIRGGKPSTDNRVFVDKIPSIPGILGHNRFEYYKALQKIGLLTTTVTDLQHLQGEAIDKQADIEMAFRLARLKAARSVEDQRRMAAAEERRREIERERIASDSAIRDLFISRHSQAEGFAIADETPEPLEMIVEIGMFMQELAAAACSKSKLPNFGLEQLKDRNSTRPQPSHNGATIRHEVEISQNLSGCERKVYDKLISMYWSRTPQFRNNDDLVRIINEFAGSDAFKPTFMGESSTSNSSNDRNHAHPTLDGNSGWRDLKGFPH